jgi:hypothetical protein
VKWVVKTSTVRVATSDGDQTYRSLEDVPPQVRDKIRETLDGPNSETVLIANREAYDRIASALSDLTPELESVPQEQPKSEPAQRIHDWRVVLAAAAFLLLGLAMIWMWLIQAGKS